MLPRPEEVPVLSFRTLGMEQGTCVRVYENHHGNGIGGKSSDCRNTVARKVVFRAERTGERPEEIFFREQFQRRVENLAYAEG